MTEDTNTLMKKHSTGVAQGTNVLGNLFSTCGATSSFYDTACVTKQFNLSYMIATWLFGLMISLMFFGLGHMIYLLDDIADNMEKIAKKK